MCYVHASVVVVFTVRRFVSFIRDLQRKKIVLFFLHRKYQQVACHISPKHNKFNTCKVGKILVLWQYFKMHLNMTSLAFIKMSYVTFCSYLKQKFWMPNYPFLFSLLLLLLLLLLLWHVSKWEKSFLLSLNIFWLQFFSPIQTFFIDVFSSIL